MADLSEDELCTVTKVTHEVSPKCKWPSLLSAMTVLLLLREPANQSSPTAELLQSASTTDKYEEPFWFIGQVFDKSWDRRITCEHSPPLEADNEN